jgi:hypothetical protein
LKNTTVNGRGCFRTSNFSGSGLPDGFGESGSTPLAGACILGTNLQTINGPSALQCFRRSNGVDASTGNDFLDGGSMAPCATALYAAYEDTVSHSLAMYRMPSRGSWAPVAGDSAIAADNHPVLIEALGFTGIWLLTSKSHTLTVRTHGTSGFGTPVTVTTDHNPADLTINGGAKIRRGRGVAGIVASAPRTVTWIAYETTTQKAGSAVVKNAIFLMRCTTTCTQTTRVGGVDPLTGRGSHAFLPALALTYKLINGVPTPMVGMTYWTDAGQTGNRLVLRQYTFNIDGTVRSGGDVTTAQVACPGTGAEYWGEYDSMYVKDGASASPSFHRSITDSTEATCDTSTRANLDYRSQNQHVSDAAYFP